MKISDCLVEVGDSHLWIISLSVLFDHTFRPTTLILVKLTAALLPLDLRQLRLHKREIKRLDMLLWKHSFTTIECGHIILTHAWRPSWIIESLVLWKCWWCLRYEPVAYSLVFSVCQVILLLVPVCDNWWKHIVVIQLWLQLLSRLNRVVNCRLHIPGACLLIEDFLLGWLLVDTDESDVIECLIEFCFFIMIIVCLLVTFLKRLINHCWNRQLLFNLRLFDLISTVLGLLQVWLPDLILFVDGLALLIDVAFHYWF